MKPTVCQMARPLLQRNGRHIRPQPSSALKVWLQISGLSLPFGLILPRRAKDRQQPGFQSQDFFNALLGLEQEASSDRSFDSALHLVPLLDPSAASMSDSVSPGMSDILWGENLPEEAADEPLCEVCLCNPVSAP